MRQADIDASQIGLSLIISDQRDQNEGFEINSLSFTAEAVSFDGTKLVLQIEFEFPHLISPDMNFPDLIQLEFLKQGKESIFKAVSDKIGGLSMKAQSLQRKVKRQIKNSGAVESFQTGTAIVRVALIYCLMVSFSLNFVLVGADVYIR